MQESLEEKEREEFSRQKVIKSSFGLLKRAAMQHLVPM